MTNGGGQQEANGTKIISNIFILFSKAKDVLEAETLWEECPFLRKAKSIDHLNRGLIVYGTYTKLPDD